MPTPRNRKRRIALGLEQEETQNDTALEARAIAILKEKQKEAGELAAEQKKTTKRSTKKTASKKRRTK